VKHNGRKQKLPTRKLVRLMPMRVLRFEKGDVLVMQTDLMLNKDQIMALRERATEQFGTDFGKIVILTAGMKLGVLRKSQR
jgi:hypothetical protein